MIAIRAAIVAAIAVALSLGAPSVNATEIGHTPEDVVRLTIDNPQADLNVDFDTNALYIVYNTDPWALTNGIRRSVFFTQIRDIVPTVLKQFPEIIAIEIVGLGTFRDIRGNDSTKMIGWLEFYRENSERIKWQNIDTNNIPEISDFGDIYDDSGCPFDPVHFAETGMPPPIWHASNPATHCHSERGPAQMSITLQK